VRAVDGRAGDKRRRGKIYLSAVANVKTGCMEPRVGVGFERIGREADAARRREVVAFGFGFGGGSAGWEADDAMPRIWSSKEPRGQVEHNSFVNTDI
jgi:hypothetical protein